MHEGIEVGLLLQTIEAGRAAGAFKVSSWRVLLRMAGLHALDGDAQPQQTDRWARL